MKPCLSKSDYTLGCQCQLALWYKKHRKDLAPEITSELQAVFDTGHEVGDLATKYFGDGKEITAKYWEIDKAITETKQFFQKGETNVFEATACAPDGEYCRIDILHKNEDESYDLIEVKSSTNSNKEGVIKKYLDDVSFQTYVFKKSGYNINKSYLMVINSSYVRNGELDLTDLFELIDLTDEAASKYNEVEETASQFMCMLKQSQPPQLEIGAHCKTPYECGYISECWQHIPEFSIFNLFNKKSAEELYLKYGAEIENLPIDEYPSGKKYIDMMCYLNGENKVEKRKITEFLGQLTYPLYFLDYETCSFGIPQFNNTKPYSQVPFQFSLHIQEEPNGKLKHFEYLHHDKSDPRKDVAKALIDNCGDKGSVLVYNESFEINVNEKLADIFPEYSDQILAINKRIVDLLIPFRNRYLYSPKQNSSASIKATLPAFVGLSYKDMEVSNGGEASSRYSRYLKGKLTSDEEATLFEGLSKYCKQDTIAMVKLLDVLRNRQGYPLMVKNAELSKKAFKEFEPYFAIIRKKHCLYLIKEIQNRLNKYNLHIEEDLNVNQDIWSKKYKREVCFIIKEWDKNISLSLWCNYAQSISVFFIEDNYSTKTEYKKKYSNMNTPINIKHNSISQYLWISPIFCEIFKYKDISLEEFKITCDVMIQKMEEEENHIQNHHNKTSCNKITTDIDKIVNDILKIRKK